MSLDTKDLSALEGAYEKGLDRGRKQMLSIIAEQVTWNYLEGGDMDTLTERINRLAKAELNDPEFTRKSLFDETPVTKSFIRKINL